MTKRHSKANAMISKSPFHTLLDSSLTPKGLSKNTQKHQSPNLVQSPQQGAVLSKSNDEIRDETPKQISSIATREGYSELQRDDTVKIGDNCNSSSISSTKTSIAIPPLYKECLILYRAKQYRSAELLAMYNLTSLAHNSIHKAHALELIADCAFHQSQYTRASSYYKQAFENCYHESVPSYGSSFSTAASHVVVSSLFQAQLKHKESECLLLSGNVVEASNLLESFIPIRSPFRTFTISMDLGRMYFTTGRLNDARRCFTDVLNKNIYALEAIECLAKMGSEKSAVSKILHQKLSSSQQKEMPSTDSKENSQYVDKSVILTSKRTQRTSFLLPFNDIVNATFYSFRGASHALHAWNYWHKVLDQYPNHTYLLLQMALLQSQYPYLLDTAVGLSTNSSTFNGGRSCIYAKIRNIDPSCMDGMDVYAYNLAKERNKSELGRLCSDLLEIDDQRHEAWATLALHHHVCGDVEKSLAFLEKAISANPRSAFCHQLMGKILQSEGRLNHAIVSYFRANEISKDVTCYEGLVEAYLSCSKYKEAVCTAKEAINFAPRDPRAMTLVGLALMSAPGSKERGREKAKRTLKKAFCADPTNRKALFSLVDLHIEEGEYDTCLDFIKRGIDESDGCGSSHNSIYDHCSLHQLYSKMAEVHIAEKKYGDALECFHKALSINPNSNEAQHGMEELEKLMKYVDTSAGSASEEYRYHSNRHPHHQQQEHQHHSYRYDPSELESLVRAI